MRKTPRFNFTVKGIQSLATPERRATFHDLQTPELGLKLEPTGHKSFFWFRKVRGVGTWKSIGEFPDVPLEQARDAARKFSSAVAKWKLADYTGDGPFEKRKGELTFAELAEAYVERHVLPHAKRKERAAKRAHAGGL